MIFATNKNIKAIIDFVACSSVAYDCADDEQQKQLLDSFSYDSLVMFDCFYAARGRMRSALTKNSDNSSNGTDN